MILPPTSQISRHYKVNNITMSPTSLSSTRIFALKGLHFKGSVLTAWNFCLLCWAVDGFDEVMLNPVEGNEVTAMTGWLIT